MWTRCESCVAAKKRATLLRRTLVKAPRRGVVCVDARRRPTRRALSAAAVVGGPHPIPVRSNLQHVPP